MALTADEFDAAVLRRAFWPSTNAPLTQAQRLSIYDEEILGTLYPKVIAAHADYYQTILDLSITADQDQYKLPMRTYGPYKDVSIVDSSGNEFSCALIDAEELGRGGWSQRYYGQLGGGTSYSFYLNGDFLNLRPVPNATQNTLRIRYYHLPNSLVLATEARKIVKIALSGTSDSYNIYTLTVNSATAPTGWATFVSTADCWVDILNGGNAHQLVLPESLVDSIAEGTFTDIVMRTLSTLPSILSAETDKSLQLDSTYGWVGWVALAGKTPIVQLPDFMLTAAIRTCAAACLEAHGDSRAGVERAMSNDLIELAISTAAPRVEGEPKMITTSNGPYRTQRAGGWWR